MAKLTDKLVGLKHLVKKPEISEEALNAYVPEETENDED